MFSDPLNDYGFYNGQDFLELELPPRLPILGGWLVESSINMLYADRGVGKSNFALGMALAIAKGEDFVGFSVSTPRVVLYLDGEMPAQEMQRRLKAFSGCQPPPFFNLYSSGQARYPIAMLNTEEGQEMVDSFTKRCDAKVLIIDNKSTMIDANKENESASWQAMHDWLMALRNNGMAVVIIHHANKGGSQRGSGMHEVILDNTIKLTRPANYKPEDTSSRFTLSFEKHRHSVGEELKPRLISLSYGNDYANWQHGTAEVPVDEMATKIIALRAEGRGVREIARELDTNPTKVSRTLKTGT